MTAIKWYLFSYRLHFNQISLNYTVVNTQSTVPNAVNCAKCTVNCAERTVNCALDIVNRMMSYIVYISLRWLYEIWSCNIVISVRWQLSNDIYLVIDYILTRTLDYTVLNTQLTVTNAQSIVHWTLLTEWCLTSYISVYDGRMKLVVVPLRSVWWQLWILLTEWCLTSYISVYDGRMKLELNHCDQCDDSYQIIYILL